MIFGDLERNFNVVLRMCDTGYECIVICDKKAEARITQFSQKCSTMLVVLLVKFNVEIRRFHRAKISN